MCKMIKKKRITCRPLFAGLVSLVTISSCAALKYNDIHTGILLDGMEVVILDRNIGAKSQKASGKYLNWKKAKASCPKGYHLLTYDEAEAIVLDDRYNIPVNLINSNIALAPFGFIIHKKGLVGDKEYGYYHLADTLNKKESWYFYLNKNDSTAIFGINYKRKHKDRMSVRCVKDFATANRD